MSLDIYEFTKGPFAQHPLLLIDSESKEAIAIDLGFDDGQIQDFIKRFISQEKLNILGIYNTHAHIDHIGVVKQFQDLFDLDFFLGAGEEVVLEHAATSAQVYNFPYSGNPNVTSYLHDGDTFKVGTYLFKVIATPGHTPGGVCYWCEQNNILIAGDTLFQGSIGRTDLPGGDHDVLLASLRKLIQLPAETKIYCGHGPQTSMGAEIEHNPFLRSL